MYSMSNAYDVSLALFHPWVSCFKAPNLHLFTYLSLSQNQVKKTGKLIWGNNELLVNYCCEICEYWGEIVEYVPIYLWYYNKAKGHDCIPWSGNVCLRTIYSSRIKFLPNHLFVNSNNHNNSYYLLSTIFYFFF